MNTLRNVVDDLYADMRANWSMATNNYIALSQAEKKLFVKSGISVLYNKQRIRSTAANISKESIEKRPCFLCPQNRPTEQRGYAWRDYWILVNPYPIFERHLTVVSQKHEEQTIVGKMRDLYALATEMGEEFIAFYNGAKCGASAPDHMHFQVIGQKLQWIVGPKTIESAEIYNDEEEGRICSEIADGRLRYRLCHAKEETAEKLLVKLLGMRDIDTDMMNAYGLRRKKETDIYIVPRLTFRPTYYYAVGDEHILVSPAAVEVGGTLVLPREEDFEKMNENIAIDILRQVCYSADNDIKK